MPPYIAGDMSEEDYKGIVRNACPPHRAPAPLWAQLTRCVPWPKCWALPPWHGKLPEPDAPLARVGPRCSASGDGGVK